MDQGISHDDLLAFELVDMRCLVVTAYHYESPRKPDVEAPIEMQGRGFDGPVFENAPQEIAEDEIEDVRALYFTVRMSHKEQRQRLVRVPVSSLKHIPP